MATGGVTNERTPISSTGAIPPDEEFFWSRMAGWVNQGRFDLADDPTLTTLVNGLQRLATQSAFQAIDRISTSRARKAMVKPIPGLTPDRPLGPFI
jgi:hypothetical protein